MEHTMPSTHDTKHVAQWRLHQIAFNESRAYEYGAAVADALRTPPFEPYGTIRAGVLRSLARRAARHALAALDLREHVAQESARNECGMRAVEPERTPNQEPLPSPAGWDVAETSVEPTARTYYVVRVNGYPRATYAAETIQEAVDIAFPTDEARLEVAEVQAPDAGAARLMNPPMGWAGPFSVTELEARMRANAPRIEPDEPVTVIAKTPAVTAPPKGWDVVEPSAEPNETFWRQARNEHGMRNPQLAVETHWEEERAYARSPHSVRKIAGVLAVAVAVAVTGLAGCHRKPVSTLVDVVTVAQYPDGTFSVDAYGPDGELLTSAHLAKDAKLADVFPVGCQPDDGDEPCGPSN